MDSIFLNWLRGARAKAFSILKEKDTDGKTARYAKDYSYLEFAAAKVITEDKEGKTKATTKAKSGQEISLIIACGIVKPDRNKILIEPTPALSSHFSYLNYQRIIEDVDVGELIITGKLRQDIDLETLGFAVRAYLLA